ncbi:spore germination protein GerW family protein [Planococcus sp. CAU13]|uniref:spore germination protein GerW family protein n=1 Tax=Planococcus sp. CAU13 TaxID=1541197 RepID=UPI000689D46A|nr:spore germination protein GerW family protein [Planococcus sp. CAU13]
MDTKSFKLPKTSAVHSIFEKFSAVRDVELVYGNPIEMHGRTIIPVAKVKYSVGGGSGGGYELEDEDPESPGFEEVEGGYGEGAGGSFSVKPLGVYDVTAEKTMYLPIISIEKIVLLPLLMTGLAYLIVSNLDKPQNMDFKNIKRMRGGRHSHDKHKAKKIKGLGHSD